METIKNLLSGNKSNTEDTTQHTGTTTNPTHSSTGTTGVAGQGSHLAGATGTSGSHNVPGAFDTTTGTTGTSSTGTTGGLGHSTHQPGATSGLSNTHNTGAHSAGTTDQHNSPVHGSNTLNQADPRVNTQTSTTGVPHSSHPGSHSEATTDQYGNPVHGSNTHSSTTSGAPLGTTAGHSSGTTGSHNAGQPVHNSNLLNKADPRVDSQTGTHGTSGFQQSTGTTTGSHGIGSQGTNSGFQQSTGTTTGAHGIGSQGTNSGFQQTTGTSTNAGPHDSNIANKADPRVDSDRDGRANPASHTGTSSGSHVGRDAAALGTGGAVGAGAHHHNDRDNLATSGQGYSGTTASGNNSAYHGGPQGTAVSGPHQTHTANVLDPNVNTSGTRNVGLEDAHRHSEKHGGGAEEADHHHSGAKAAAGAGAVGLASHQKHDNTTGVGHSTHGTTGHSTTTGTGYGTSTNAGPHDSNLANKADPRVDSDRDGRSNPTSSTGHSNTGRNAALGAGAVGAAGLAGREHNQHQGNVTGTGHSESGQRAFPVSGGTTGHTSGTSTNVGPHDSNIANKADPRVDSDRDGRSHPTHAAGTTGHNTTGHNTAGHNTTGHTATGTGAGHSTGHSGTQGATGHHTGRDAAVGTGVGAGAAGLGAHEHNKHDPTSALPGPAPNTAGPHSKDWLNKLDPRVHSKEPADSSSHSGTHDSHTGRNAAGVGAVGAGAGAYAADKHHDKHNVNQPGHSTTTGTTGHSTTTAGPHSSNVANKADPSVDSDRSKDHHYGRDAAGVGAVGAGAHAADKHHDKHNVNQPGHSTTTGTTGHSTTTAGPHSSNVANKADPSVDSDRSKDHHYGRDAAGVGAVGAGAHEADKHHKHDAKDTKHATQEKDHSKGGILSFLHRDKNKKYTPAEEAEFDRQEREHNSHKGLGAAGTGAAGVGAYEAGKHHDGHSTGTSNLDNKPLPTAPGNHGVGTGAGAQNALAGSHSGVSSAPHHDNTKGGAVPLDEKPVGTDLGDKLHGAARNRGVAHAHESTTGSHGVGNDHHTSSTATGHHTGRDATALGGAAAVGEHEHRKHDNVGSTGTHGAGYGTSTNAGPHDSNVANKADPRVDSDRDGRSGAGYGTAGHSTAGHSTTGAGYGTSTNAGPHDSNLANKADPRIDSDRDGRSAAGYGTTGQHTTGSGLTGNQTSSHTTHGAGYGEDDRNRLHKEPHSSHVPGSLSERSNIVGQGQDRLNENTGVANSHANPNTSTNY
ncbi:hypothetical protein PVAG01_03791 [Phlyctema vagabunda]|uniref:Cell surface protein n=1 Tax=Phlyctema vagabunda TaxID=108571 RepID=A0ABR4PME6_9HELO